MSHAGWCSITQNFKDSKRDIKLPIRAFPITIVIQIYKKKFDSTNRRAIITSWRMFHLWETSIAFWTLWSYDDATQHKTPSVCTELARSKTVGKIKRMRCCGTRTKVSWGMSNIVAQQGKNPFKDEAIYDIRCRHGRWNQSNCCCGDSDSRSGSTTRKRRRCII